ncbi:uncharacterized protein LOC126809805 [Patella vulgata]|uniref:uncharacterized protein LOC126809805 n=1 Tax=Patella vulgata TaxID=6465 RepID=UPI00217F4450|nr:uncharacterized protein LOC126809805 [Patella vulgata]
MTFLSFNSIIAYLNIVKLLHKQARLPDSLPEIGIDPSKYAGHSFRRGGASFAFNCDVPTDLIQL